MGVLHAAVQRGNIREVLELLEYADVNDYSSDFYPPLHLACKAENLHVRSNPFVYSKHLDMYIRFSNVHSIQMAQVLISRGADVNLLYNYDAWDSGSCELLHFNTSHPHLIFFTHSHFFSPP